MKCFLKFWKVFCLWCFGSRVYNIVWLFNIEIYIIIKDLWVYYEYLEWRS